MVKQIFANFYNKFSISDEGGDKVWKKETFGISDEGGDKKKWNFALHNLTQNLRMFLDIFTLE